MSDAPYNGFLVTAFGIVATAFIGGIRKVIGLDMRVRVLEEVTKVQMLNIDNRLENIEAALNVKRGGNRRES